MNAKIVLTNHAIYPDRPSRNGEKVVAEAEAQVSAAFGTDVVVAALASALENLGVLSTGRLENVYRLLRVRLEQREASDLALANSCDSMDEWMSKREALTA